MFHAAEAHLTRLSESALHGVSTQSLLTIPITQLSANLWQHPPPMTNLSNTLEAMSDIRHQGAVNLTDP